MRKHVVGKPRTGECAKASGQRDSLSDFADCLLWTSLHRRLTWTTSRGDDGAAKAVHHGVDGPANRARGAAHSSVRVETGSIAMISMRLKQREGPKAAREFAAKMLAAAAPTPAEIAHQAITRVESTRLLPSCQTLQSIASRSVAQMHPYSFAPSLRGPATAARIPPGCSSCRCNGRVLHLLPAQLHGSVPSSLREAANPGGERDKMLGNRLSLLCGVTG